VQVQFHEATRSLTKAIPRSTPIPSNQSAGTKHVRRDDVFEGRSQNRNTHRGPRKRFHMR
jgi:hypothetical protein